MRRKPLLNRTPLRGKPKPVRQAKQTTCTPRPRPVARSSTELPMSTPAPKVKPWRSEPYRRLVATMPCYWCGLEKRSQAAHGPTLGARIKCGDEETFPLCADGPGGYSGCHGQFDRYEIFPRWRRDEVSRFWARAVRAELRARCAELGIDLPAEREERAA